MSFKYELKITKQIVVKLKNWNWTQYLEVGARSVYLLGKSVVTFIGNLKIANIIYKSHPVQKIHKTYKQGINGHPIKETNFLSYGVSGYSFTTF